MAVRAESCAPSTHRGMYSANHDLAGAGLVEPGLYLIHARVRPEPHAAQGGRQEGRQGTEEAGADHVGNDDLIKRIEDGWTDFDVSIATPDMMGKIGRLGRVLGRRGLMPNPRTGTVVQPDNIAKAVSDAKKGRVEYRLDRDALIHVVIGKSSFDESQLLDNLTALMDTIIRARPGGVKGQFVRSAFLTTTMGPSVRLDVATVTALKVE